MAQVGFLCVCVFFIIRQRKYVSKVIVIICRFKFYYMNPDSTELLLLLHWWVFSQSTGSCLSIVWERIVVQSWGKKVMGGRESAIASVHWNYQWSHSLIKSLRLCRERTRLRWLLWKFTAAKWSYVNGLRFGTARRSKSAAHEKNGPVGFRAVEAVDAVALPETTWYVSCVICPVYSDSVHAVQCDTITVSQFLCMFNLKLCGTGIRANEIWMCGPTQHDHTN